MLDPLLAAAAAVTVTATATAPAPNHDYTTLDYTTHDYTNHDYTKPDPTLDYINQCDYATLSGQDQGPRRYLRLYSATRRLAALLTTFARLPGGFPAAARLVVDFATGVLRAPTTCFARMLNSQRGSIYNLLDDALVGILLREWEGGEGKRGAAWARTRACACAWDVQTRPVVGALARGMGMVPGWAVEDSVDLAVLKAVEPEVFARESEWLLGYYFARSRRFLEESMAVYGVRVRSDMVVKGRLPVELVERVVEMVSEEEGVPTRELRGRVESKDMFTIKTEWANDFHKVFPRVKALEM